MWCALPLSCVEEYIGFLVRGVWDRCLKPFVVEGRMNHHHSLSFDFDGLTISLTPPVISWLTSNCILASSVTEKFTQTRGVSPKLPARAHFQWTLQSCSCSSDSILHLLDICHVHLVDSFIIVGIYLLPRILLVLYGTKVIVLEILPQSNPSGQFQSIFEIIKRIFRGNNDSLSMIAWRWE